MRIYLQFFFLFLFLFRIDCRYEAVFNDAESYYEPSTEYKPLVGATTFFLEDVYDEKFLLIFFGNNFVDGELNPKLEIMWRFDIQQKSFERIGFEIDLSFDENELEYYKGKKYSSGIEVTGQTGQNEGFHEYFFFGGQTLYQNLHFYSNGPTNDFWKYTYYEESLGNSYYELIKENTKFANATTNTPGGRMKHVFIRSNNFAVIIGGYGYLTEPSIASHKNNKYPLNDIWTIIYSSSSETASSFNLTSGCISYEDYQHEQIRRANRFVERFGHSAAFVSNTELLVFGGAKCNGNLEQCFLNEVLKITFGFGEKEEIDKEGNSQTIKFLTIKSIDHIGGNDANDNNINNLLPKYEYGNEQIGGKRDFQMIKLDPTNFGEDQIFMVIGGYGLENSNYATSNRLGVRGDEWRMKYSDSTITWNFIGREETRYNNVLANETLKIFGGISEFISGYDEKNKNLYFGNGVTIVNGNATILDYILAMQMDLNTQYDYDDNHKKCFESKEFKNQLQLIYDIDSRAYQCICRPGYYKEDPDDENGECDYCDPNVDCSTFEAVCETFNDAKECVCDSIYAIYSGNCSDQTTRCGIFTYDSQYVCNNRKGKCIATDVLGIGKCQCDAPYGGEFCQYYSCNNIFNNETDKICGGNGICSINQDQSTGEEKGDCICNTGYSGSNCESWHCNDILKNDTSNVCSGNGQCLSPNNCQCKDGWIESFCSKFQCFGIDKDNETVCSGNGICTNANKCLCDISDQKTIFKTIHNGDNCQNVVISEQMQWVLTGTGIGGVVFFIFLFLIAVVVAFCCLMASYQRKLKQMEIEKSKTTQLEDIEVNEMNKQIANLKINKDLFKINMEDIQITSKIGQGGFATVFLGEYQHMKVAFKAFNTDFLFKTTDGETNDFENFEKELHLFSSLNHTNIPRFYGASLKPPRCGIVMEYCPNGDLESYLKKNKCSFEEKMKFMDGIVKGMIFLHSKNLIHRDLKPENILLGENNIIKICDFGLSRIDNDTKKTQAIGTNLYMSPEVFLGRAYDKSADVFSFGMILYVCISENFVPYPSMTMETQIKISNNPNYRPDIMDIEKSIRDQYPWIIKLIKKCYSHNPKDRPSFTDILSTIENEMQ